MITGNEPAMPIECSIQAGDSAAYGLTIRQHFAAMAMQGLLSNHRIVTGDVATISVSNLAVSATHYANALIAELNKQSP